MVGPSVTATTTHQFLVVRLLRLRRIAHWYEYASFDSLLSCDGLGHLWKGWIVHGTTITGLWALLPDRLYRFSA